MIYAVDPIAFCYHHKTLKNAASINICSRNKNIKWISHIIYKWAICNRPGISKRDNFSHSPWKNNAIFQDYWIAKRLKSKSFFAISGQIFEQILSKYFEPARIYPGNLISLVQWHLESFDDHHSTRRILGNAAWACLCIQNRLCGQICGAADNI